MKEKAEQAVQDFLEALHLDLSALGMEKTPQRVASLYGALFSGLDTDPKSVWGQVFPTDYKGLVALKDIPFYSICEHHLMPFFGTVDVVYQPHEGRVAGLSKVADVIRVLAARPQLQERLSAQLADSLEQDLGAEGLIIRIKATHLCMLMRGEVQPGTQAMTLERRGLLAEQGPLGQEGLLLLGGVHDEN